MASTDQWKESKYTRTDPSLTPHSISFSEKRAVQRKSLQTIPVNDNLSKLKRLRDSTKSIVLHNKIDALSCVLEDLLYQHNDLESIGPTIYERYTSKRANGIIDFQVGLDIYADFMGAPLYVRKDDLSTRFKDDLLDPVHGVRCIVYNPPNYDKKYIILDSDGVDILGILQRITDDFEDAENIRVRVRENIDYGYINTALLTLDTEHDRTKRTAGYDQKKYGYCVKRLTEKLIKENRIKARRLGAGARPMLDSDDEEFIANAIESKSSAHGRRHDTVLYLNHRVTGSFVPKTPKTEDHSTELTHHQRAHVKLNREDMFSTNSLFRYSSLTSHLMIKRISDQAQMVSQLFFIALVSQGRFRRGLGRITHFARLLERVLANFPNTGPDELIDKLKEALQLIEKLNQDLKGENMRICNRNLKTLRDQCEEIIRSIDSMNIYPVKPVISEYTDGGPGVGVNNTAVKFRFAEMSRIQNSVRRVRIHRASGDSAQNEAERTNSAIGDALVDGATICWEYFKPLHGLSQEDQDAMTPSDLDKHKAAMMEKNAWAVAEVVSLRIDDAKGPAGFIQAYVTEHPEDQFFWNGNYLKRYHESSKSAKATVPGHGYFKKIYEFIDQHCEVGELYIEYRKYRCEQSHGTKCEYCLRSPVNDLYGPNLVKPVPRPYPDYERLPDLHYLVHSNTPVQIDNVEREPDDFQPRANIKKLFALGELSTSNHASVSQFSKKQTDNVVLLDKYIQHHNLGNFTVKPEKVKAVKQSIAMHLIADNNQVNEIQSDEDDVIIELFDPDTETETDSSSSSSESEREIENLQISTRSRRVRLPKRYDDYVT
ncbi:unnamed protein product [Mytilus edulis]|uniref:Uncharacterized protein n=1 Tax=Mytilus edulis TaxID=6550 RepID=A0A8S3VQX6_MYTED|nr:unnamed protein product [Mytilus edulis]